MAVHAKAPSSCLDGWGSIPRAGTPPLYQKCQKSVYHCKAINIYLRGMWWHDDVLNHLYIRNCLTISNIQWWMCGTLMEVGSAVPKQYLKWEVVPDQPHSMFFCSAVFQKTVFWSSSSYFFYFSLNWGFLMYVFIFWCKIPLVLPLKARIYHCLCSNTQNWTKMGKNGPNTLR